MRPRMPPSAGGAGEGAGTLAFEGQPGGGRVAQAGNNTSAATASASMRRGREVAGERIGGCARVDDMWEWPGLVSIISGVG